MIQFQCKLCDFIEEYEDAPFSCPECGSKSYTLVFKKDCVERGKKKQVTENERWSWSMAVPESQREEYKKRFPNHVLDKHGRVLIKNRRDKLQKMKDRGMVEWTENESPWKN